jgi:formylglycine-generating enzyme required for sulfatase activity
VRALPCGSLLPNDLGLADMLGNVWEWCQDRYMTKGTGEQKLIYYHITISVIINEQYSRILRGGAYLNHAALVRSAYRPGFAPASRLTYIGFRPARTLP